MPDLELARKVGERIRSLREKKKLTLGDVADKSGVDKSRLSKIERGQAETSLERYAAIAKALAVPLSEVIDA